MLSKKYRIFNPINSEVLNSYEPSLWPFYVYEIIAPTVEIQDIFAKFFLSVVRVENKKFLLDEFSYDKTSIAKAKKVIKQQLPTLFSDELLDKIIAAVEEMNLINNNKISETGFNELFNSEVSLSNNLKKIILLQDAVSGEVVPHIDFINDFESISDSRLRYSIKSSIQKRPSLLQIQKAYNYSQLIEERIIKGISNDEYEEAWFDDESDLDERFVFNLIKDENISKNATVEQNIEKNSQILFLNDQPLLVYFEFLPYSSMATGEISFLSPFFDSSNTWFSNVVHKSKSINDDVSQLVETIKLLSEEKRIKYQDQIKKEIKEKINPELEKEFLQDELSILIKKLGQPGLEKTYEQIQELQQIKARTVNTEYGVFLEELFDFIGNLNKSEFQEIKNYVNQGRVKFQETIQFLGDIKKIEIPTIYYDKTRYDQISQFVDKKINKIQFFITKVSYLLLLEAYYKKTILHNIIEDDKKILIRLKLLNSARNSNSHYTDDKIDYNFKEISNEFAYVVKRIIIEYLERSMNNGEK